MEDGPTRLSERSETETIAPTTYARPDWDNPAQHDVACPLCRYNLRGLIDPRGPWLSFAALMILGESMRRCRINVWHVVRCVVYNSDIGVWVAIAALFVNILRASAFAYSEHEMRTPGWRCYGYLPAEFIPYTWVLWPLAGLIFVYRQIVAYRYYLRFPHDIATILVTQIIVILTVVTIVLFIATEASRPPGSGW